MKVAQTALPPILLAAVFVIAWGAIVRLAEVSPTLVPGPYAVAAALVSDAATLMRHAQTTLFEVIVGFAGAIIAGTLLGTVIALSPLAARALYPALIAAQVMPKVAIAPLLIVWFGFGQTPVVILTGLIAFFPVVINTIVGLNMTPDRHLRLFRALGATRSQMFVKLLVPTGLPVLFGGAKVASTLAVIGAVVGEFAGADRGLGYLLTVQVGRIQTAAAFANIFCLTMMGLALFGAVVLAERLIVPAHRIRSIASSM